VGTPADPLCDTEAIEVRKTVTPSVATSGVETTFHYRIEIENKSASNRRSCWMWESLPPGFTPVGGSVTGNYASGNGYWGTVNGQQVMFWPFWCLFGGKVINAGQMKYTEFDARATLTPGYYSNQVWVNFDTWLNSAYSGPTAEVQVFDVYDLVVANENVSATAQVWMGANNSYEVTQWQVVGNE
jgi:hypothetical protein